MTVRPTPPSWIRTLLLRAPDGRPAWEHGHEAAVAARRAMRAGTAGGRVLTFEADVDDPRRLRNLEDAQYAEWAAMTGVPVAEAEEDDWGFSPEMEEQYQDYFYGCHGRRP